MKVLPVLRSHHELTTPFLLTGSVAGLLVSVVEARDPGEHVAGLGALFEGDEVGDAERAEGDGHARVAVAAVGPRDQVGHVAADVGGDLNVDGVMMVRGGVYFVNLYLTDRRFKPSIIRGQIKSTFTCRFDGLWFSSHLLFMCESN